MVSEEKEMVSEEKEKELSERIDWRSLPKVMEVLI